MRDTNKTTEYEAYLEVKERIFKSAYEAPHLFYINSIVVAKKTGFLKFPIFLVDRVFDDRVELYKHLEEIKNIGVEKFVMERINSILSINRESYSFDEKINELIKNASNEKMILNLSKEDIKALRR